MRVAAALSLLALTLVATGGEARAGDGVSGRQLLMDPKPVSCKDSKCDKVLKYPCEWLPAADTTCKTDNKYKVPVKNCFNKKIDYISISVNGKCTKCNKYDDKVLTELDLKCGDKITIFGYDKYFKGNTTKACGDDSSSRVAGNYCKTCMYEAEYKCPYAVHTPGDKCRDAKGDCDLPSYFDKRCKCPDNDFRDAYHVCRNSTGPCDRGAKCTGNDATCPPSSYKDKHVMCRKHSDKCAKDAYCDGHKAECPPEEFYKSTKVCRRAYDLCDTPAKCNGNDAKCPPNGFKPPTEMCRDAAGPCDAPEFCDGQHSYCPKDVCIDHRTELNKEHPYCPAKRT